MGDPSALLLHLMEFDEDVVLWDLFLDFSRNAILLLSHLNNTAFSLLRKMQDQVCRVLETQTYGVKLLTVNLGKIPEEL